VPSWGRHLIDVQEGLGNLVALVSTQGKGYLAKTRSRQ
jgi:hypothetical protein